MLKSCKEICHPSMSSNSYWSFLVALRFILKNPSGSRLFPLSLKFCKLCFLALSSASWVSFYSLEKGRDQIFDMHNVNIINPTYFRIYLTRSVLFILDTFWNQVYRHFWRKVQLIERILLFSLNLPLITTDHNLSETTLPSFTFPFSFFTSTQSLCTQQPASSTVKSSNKCLIWRVRKPELNRVGTLAGLS